MAPARQQSASFRPVAVAEWDVLQPFPCADPLRNTLPLRLLIRLGSEPLGFVEIDDSVGSRLEAATRVSTTFLHQINTRLADSDLPEVDEVPAEGLNLEPAALAFVAQRRKLLQSAADISVVVCTRDRASRLSHCVALLAQQDYPNYEIVVVDNAPADPHAVPAVLATLDAPVPVRYVLEPRGGLSWARNAGWKAAVADIVAFLDDDEVPDQHWLAELVRGFSAAPHVGCVTGMVLPAELRTEPQQWFEGLGGFSQGRGFEQEIFVPGHSQNPLFPFPPFGAGANMAFRRRALEDVGGFDVALGAGTPAKASEETLAFAQVRLAQHTIVYQPTALVSHYHRETLAELKTQLHNYSVGTTAHYTALVLWRPRLFFNLLLLLPQAIRDNLPWKNPGRAATMRNSPAVLILTQFVGMVKGPFAYFASARLQRRVAKGLAA